MDGLTKKGGSSSNWEQIKPFFSIPVDTQYYTVTGLALDGLTKVKKKGGLSSNCGQIKPFLSIPVDTILYCNGSSRGWR